MIKGTSDIEPFEDDQDDFDKAGKDYSQGDIRKIWGGSWAERLHRARVRGDIESWKSGTVFVYEADALAIWREKQGK